MHLYEKSNSRGHLNGPVMTPSPVSVFEYVVRYQTSSDAEPSGHMQTDGRALKVGYSLVVRCGTDVTGWTECWNHWGDRSYLRCLCVAKETDLPVVRC